jgi:hypothetical protein
MPSIQNMPSPIAKPHADASAPAAKAAMRPVTKIMQCVEKETVSAPRAGRTSVAQAVRHKLEQAWLVLTVWLGALLHLVSGGRLPATTKAAAEAPKTADGAQASAPATKQGTAVSPEAVSTDEQPQTPAPRPIMVSTATQTEAQAAPPRPGMVDKGSKARASRAATAPLNATLTSMQNALAELTQREAQRTQERDEALCEVKRLAENKHAARSGQAAAEREQRDALVRAKAALVEADQTLCTTRGEVATLREALAQSREATRTAVARSTQEAQTAQAARRDLQVAQREHRTALDASQDALAHASRALEEASGEVEDLHRKLQEQIRSGDATRAEMKLVAQELKGACHDLEALELNHRKVLKRAEKSLSHSDEDLEALREQVGVQANENNTLTQDLRNVRRKARETYKELLSEKDTVAELKKQMHSNEEAILASLEQALNRNHRQSTPEPSVFEAVAPSARAHERPTPPRYNRAGVNEFWRQREAGEL